MSWVKKDWKEHVLGVKNEGGNMLGRKFFPYPVKLRQGFKRQ